HGVVRDDTRRVGPALCIGAGYFFGNPLLCQLVSLDGECTGLFCSGFGVPDAIDALRMRLDPFLVLRFEELAGAEHHQIATAARMADQGGRGSDGLSSSVVTVACFGLEHGFTTVAHFEALSGDSA